MAKRVLHASAIGLRRHAASAGYPVGSSRQNFLLTGQNRRWRVDHTGLEPVTYSNVTQFHVVISLAVLLQSRASFWKRSAIELVAHCGRGPLTVPEVDRWASPFNQTGVRSILF